MVEKYFEMTQAGVNRLQEELDVRKLKTRQEVGERIKVALSFGDLSENSEYDDAKREQAENESRILEIEELLKNVHVIEEEDISTNNVSLGAIVTLRDEKSGLTYDYHLVSPQEEDILQNKISTSSPVGQALLGKKRNQSINVTTPTGNYKYKLMKISRETKDEKARK